MAYVLLPPAGGVLLLITEHKSDYVRFVAFPVRVLGEEARLTCVYVGFTRGRVRCCLRLWL
jgi:hypothetical protein